MGTSRSESALDVTIRLEFLDEEDVTDEQRALAGDLLWEAFRNEIALGRGCILHRPAYRAFAWAGNELVGVGMGCFPQCDPPIRLCGLGDGAVRAEWRGRGIWRAISKPRFETLRQIEPGIEAMLGCTQFGSVLLDLGFRPVGSGELRLGRPGGKIVDLHRGWYVHWFREPVPLLLERRF